MRKSIAIWALGLFSLPIAATAQDFTYPDISLQTVSFSGSTLTIRPDGTTSSYVAPHYTAGAVKQDPVAYMAGSTPRVSAVFSFACANAPDSLWVRGWAPDSVAYPARQIAVTGTSGSYGITYPATDAAAAFTSATVGFYKPYTIDWEVSFDNGTTWRAAGSSGNPVYVTRLMPMSETSAFKYWETVYDISCRNAVGMTSDTAVISHVWTEFTDQEVFNCDGDSLHYYKTLNTSNTTLSALLSFRNAQCYTFAQLFLATLKIQGVNKSNNYVFITPDLTPYCTRQVNRFLVKNWAFGTPTGTYCADFPYTNTYTTLVPPPYTAYNWLTADVTDQLGIPGSCSPNPASFFNNHQITKINGVYYDPCYGVTFASLADIPTVAFDGWAFRFTSGSVTEAYFTNDMGKAALTESITTW